jgi:ABC-type Fe3+-hydroxamate transport system substrate-binding protein
MPNIFITDALGRLLQLPAPPQRIVSLVPSLTETLFAFGAGERLVGITDFCVEPAAEVAGLPKVRGTKNPNREAIRELQPDLILAAKEENRERDVAAFEAMSLPVYVTDMRSMADVVTQCAALADLLEVAASAAPLIDELRELIAEAEARLQRRTKRRYLLAFIWRDPWMAVGADTYADDVLRLAGAINLAHELPGRYPRADLEDFLDLDPELILLPGEPYAFSDEDVLELASFGDEEFPGPRIALCDGMALTWPGPRSADALRLFTTILE